MLLVCALSVVAFVLKGQSGVILTDPVRSIKLKLFTIMSVSKVWEIVKASEALCAAVHGVAKSWTWLSD